MTPETPITDALWAHLSQHGWGREHLPCSTIMESHEKLERELANHRKWSSELADAFDDLKAELSAEWALADRLLTITEKAVSDYEGTLHCADDCKCSRRRTANDNAQALAAWKGDRHGTK